MRYLSGEEMELFLASKLATHKREFDLTGFVITGLRCTCLLCVVSGKITLWAHC